MSGEVRVALLTLALPRREADKNGLFNIRQAQALARVGGGPALIVTVYPRLIRWLHRRRGSGGPDEVRHDGVEVRAVTGLFWYFHPVVLPLQNRWPLLVTRWLDLACGRRVARAVADHGADLVVVQAALPWGDVALRLKRTLGVPVLFTEHDGRLLSPSRLERSASALRRFCGGVDGTLVVSPSGAERMRALDLPRVHHVANGVDVVAVERAAVGRPARYDGRFVVLWIGTLRPEKGLDLLLHACAQVAASTPVTLVAIGAEGREPDPELMATTGLEVELRPVLAQEAVFGAMSWCDVFALPSWHEAWGLVYAEAMAAGRPVVMTEDCGMAHEVTDGREGFVVEPRQVAPLAAALTRLASDPHLGPRMGARGRDRVRSLSWDHNAARVLAVAGLGPADGADPVAG